MTDDPKVSVKSLSAVPETLLIPLIARARGRELYSGLGFRDPSAEAVLGRLDHQAEKFLEDRHSVYGIMKRTQLFRELAREFFRRRPGATGVNLGCGLSDYFQWLDLGRNRWIDFDLPVVMDVRRRVLTPQCERHRFVAGSLTESGWWDLLELPSEQPVFLLCEGVLMYLKPEEVHQVLATFGEMAAPGSWFVFDHMCWLAVGRGKKHPSVKKTRAEFYWGPRGNRDLTAPHPRLRLESQHLVMESFGLPYSVIGPVFRQLTGVPFYAISRLEAA